MKKKAALLICTILVFCLAACGADNNGSNRNNADNITAVSSEPSVENIPAAAPEEAVGESGTETAEDPAGAETDTTGSNILIAYFSVPEDVDITGVDAVAGASVVVKDGEKLGNTEYVAKLIQQTIGGDLFRIETIESYQLDHDPLVDQAAEEQDDDFRPELAARVENFGEYDFSGKTIIPFNVHNGSRFSGTISTIRELEPDASVVEDGFTVSERSVADAEEDVQAWLNGLGY